jgi:hypothetical protein
LPGSFEFIVMIDTHYLDEQCGVWSGRVVSAMRERAPEAAFCPHAGDVTDRGTREGCTQMTRIFGALATARR